MNDIKFIKKHNKHDVNVNYVADSIFSQSGVKLIPVNDCFDVKVDDVIVDRYSLHGMAISKHFSKDVGFKILNTRLKEGLENVDKEIITRSGLGLSNRYPIGTCVYIEYADQKFIFAAFTHTCGDNNSTTCDPKNYSDSLKTILKNATDLCISKKEEKLFIPFIGGGLSFKHIGIARSILQFSFISILFDFLSLHSINLDLYLVELTTNDGFLIEFNNYAAYRQICYGDDIHLK